MLKRHYILQLIKKNQLDFLQITSNTCVYHWLYAIYLKLKI